MTLQEGRHVRQVGKLVSISCLGAQGKLNESITEGYMAQDGGGIGASPDALEDLFSLLFVPRLEDFKDFLGSQF